MSAPLPASGGASGIDDEPLPDDEVPADVEPPEDDAPLDDAVPDARLDAAPLEVAPPDVPDDDCGGLPPSATLDAPLDEAEAGGPLVPQPSASMPEVTRAALRRMRSVDEGIAGYCARCDGTG
jgi:hypothetical protein